MTTLTRRSMDFALDAVGIDRVWTSTILTVVAHAVASDGSSPEIGGEVVPKRGGEVVGVYGSRVVGCGSYNSYNTRRLMCGRLRLDRPSRGLGTIAGLQAIPGKRASIREGQYSSRLLSGETLKCAGAALGEATADSVVDANGERQHLPVVELQV